MDHKLAAPTPPLGWNSWDCYGAAVTEDDEIVRNPVRAETCQRKQLCSTSERV
ncbi:hypothetical protein J1TS5_34360 [Paenibacillus macerans]|nr:hypothetical protein J1TS5_34360 [Paenibacillus macerans]